VPGISAKNVVHPLANRLQLVLKQIYLVAGELALTFRQIHDNFVINLHRSLILFGSNRNWST
jgi:hypothetical protein